MGKRLNSEPIWLSHIPGMKDYNMTIRGNLKSHLFGFEVCRLSLHNTRFRTLNICLLYS